MALKSKDPEPKSEENDDELFSSMKDKLRYSGVITNVAAKEYMKKHNQSNKPKPIVEENDIETSKKKGLNNIFKFPWKRRDSDISDKDKLSSSSHDYPAGHDSFLVQAQKKVAESSEAPLSRRTSSKQVLALMSIGSSLKWANMSARWNQSLKNVLDDVDDVGKSTSRRNSDASDDWMLSEAAVN